MRLSAASARELRLPGRLARLAVLFVAAIVVLIGATPASAHGGPYTLTVTPDGGGGISVIAKYDADGHIVEEIMDPVMTARSATGETVGPISLISASEGVGVWITPEPALDEGDWIVTVTTTTPEESTATAEFSVAPLEDPVPAATEPAATDATTAPTSSSPTWIWVGVGVIAVLVAVGGVLWARRRRTADRT